MFCAIFGRVLFIDLSSTRMSFKIGKFKNYFILLILVLNISPTIQVRSYFFMLRIFEKISFSFQKVVYVGVFYNVTLKILPDYGASNVTIKNKNTWSTNFSIYQSLENPKIDIDVYELNANTLLRRLLKLSCRICDIERLVNTNSGVAAAAKLLTEDTNMPLSCPIPPGNYYLRNIRITSRMIPLAMFYKANTFHAVEVAFTVQKPGEKRIQVARTYLKFKLFKTNTRN